MTPSRENELLDLLESHAVAIRTLQYSAASVTPIIWAHREILATVLQRLRDDAGEIAWENARSALESRARAAEREEWPGLPDAAALMAREIRMIANADLPLMAKETLTEGAA